MTARPMSPAREAALAVLEELVESRARSERIQAAMREEWTDLYGLFLPGRVEAPVVALIDAVLGETLGSYLLYECRRGGGRIILPDQTEHLIRTVDDVRAYLDATDPEAVR